MMQQFVSQLAAVALGGIIAAIAGFSTTYFARHLDRKDRHRSELIDAFAAWAESFHSLISITENYSKLVLQRGGIGSADPQQERTYDDELLRTSIEAGNAGRKLDCSLFRIVLLEQTEEVRCKVDELTKSTKINLTDDQRASAQEYVGRVPSLQEKLHCFLSGLANSKHFG